MPVDKTARRLFGDAIERYLSGKIDNFALDDVLFFGPKTDDVLCNEIATEVYYCYDDCSRHKNSGRHQIRSPGEHAFRRLIELLRSETQWRWAIRTEPKGLLATIANAFRSEPSQLQQNIFWPLSSEEDWAKWRESGTQ